jgi:predicted aspartyl protease
MQLTLRDELPFVTVVLRFRGAAIEIPDVLVDTGSGGTVLAADWVARVGLNPEPTDALHTIHGVGGTEVVFARRVDRLDVGADGLANFEVEVGGMLYGFAINGILGMDFLTRAGAVIDLKALSIEFASA